MLEHLKEVNDFGTLRQLVLVEEFKSCIPAYIQTYLDKQKVENLHQTAVRADDYSLTHKPVFRRTCPQPLDQSENIPGEKDVSSNLHDSSPPASVDLMSNTNANSSRLPAGPICFYCKERGHIMSECFALEKKNKRTTANAILVPSQLSFPNIGHADRG